MYLPDVWDRNLVSLICSGAFNAKTTIEPMSAYKWQKMVDFFHNERILDVFADGAERHYYNERMNVSPKLVEQVSDAIKKSPPLAFAEKYNVGTTILYNSKLNERLTAILKEEYTNDEKSWETLQLLTVIITTAHHLMTGGHSVRCLIDLGCFLRNESDRVDYDKLKSILGRLHLRRVARLEGQLLMGAFDFSLEEIPFLKKGTRPKTEEFFTLCVHPRHNGRRLLLLSPRETLSTLRTPQSSAEEGNETE